MDKLIVTTSEAAKLLGISVRTAQLLIEGGSLNSWKTPGGHRRVYRADVMALIAKNHQVPALSSTLVVVLASPERLPLFEKLLSKLSGYSVDSYSDAHSASFAIGLRLPAAVIVDLEEKGGDRQSFLRTLMSNPELAHMRIIAIGGHIAITAEQKSSRRFTRIAELASLPKTVRTILRDSTESLSLIKGTPSFPLAVNESQRLVALERSALVDTAPEESFDRLTELASRSLKMPVALFTMLTSTRQWFKSRQGLEMKQTPRSWAFCNHTILQKDVFTVEDLARDARFADNPAVTGSPNFRFYAGAPVIDANGFALGSLCVIDYKPRNLDREQLQTLRAFAQFTSDAVQLRAANRQLHWALDALKRRH